MTRSARRPDGRPRWPRSWTEAAAQGRIAAALGCGAAAARAYQAAGLTSLYLGDEAVLDLDRFTLEGRAVRIARQSWHRARRAGLTATVSRVGGLDPDELAAPPRPVGPLARRRRPSGASPWPWGACSTPGIPPGSWSSAGDAAGHPLGLLHLVPWDGDGASLDAMRRDRDAPTILNDFLVVEAARQLPALGIRRLSLNFSFLRAILDAGPDLGLSLRAARWGLRRLSRRFPIQSLYQFNKKFAPAWQPRYLAVQTAEELATVAVACLRAEGLLTPAAWSTRRGGFRTCCRS